MAIPRTISSWRAKPALRRKTASAGKLITCANSPYGMGVTRRWRSTAPRQLADSGLLSSLVFRPRRGKAVCQRTVRPHGALKTPVTDFPAGRLQISTPATSFSSSAAMASAAWAVVLISRSCSAVAFRTPSLIRVGAWKEYASVRKNAFGFLPERGLRFRPLGN